MRNVNLLALLVVVVAGALVWHGDVDPDAFLLLITGLAIPARTDGYQSVGAGPASVKVVNDAEDAIPVDPEAGHMELQTAMLWVAIGTIAYVIGGLILRHI